MSPSLGYECRNLNHVHAAYVNAALSLLNANNSVAALRSKSTALRTGAHLPEY